MVMYVPFQEGIKVLGASINSVIASLPSVPFLVDKYFIDVGLPIPAKNGTRRVVFTSKVVKNL